MSHCEIVGQVAVVYHVGVGTIGAAKSICADLESAVMAGRVRAILHDAECLTGIENGYQTPFMEIEKQIAGRVELVVCFVPKTWLRVLAKAVSLVSGHNHWQFVESRATAEVILAQAGLRPPGNKLAHGEGVNGALR